MDEEEKVDDFEAVDKIRALILRELEQYSRFHIWVEANYDIHVAPDPDTKTIAVKVVEVMPEDAVARLQKRVQEEMAKDDSSIQVVGADVLRKLDS